MRLFFAVTVDPAARAKIITGRPLENISSLRWVKPEQQHFTLCFLGEESPDRLPKIIAAGKSAAGRHQAFRIRLRETGFFPERGDPRIFWVGVDQGASEIERLAADLRAELRLRSLGFDARPFIPHLTLARINGRLTGPDRERLRGFSPGTALLPVPGFRLLESRLAPDGASYFELASFELSEE
ncbi:MAG TPA: RNA 2',3'-cyclic phosphodiesterase [bacterium]|uniref:RNA 2',3'-cyclic phosphodiesterase n=1 Tax=candidate division TA06 bacterium ADurb.Bin417 TaxID=1852828 RepID=A0A1V5MFQ3_UNCT6|nr:MAG: 2',5' RNA ligase family [candidate division TA06 bacterium ADurb.Bin417]HNQ35594.1 RNA 2',3'-cyclic phosphodiesterase [bacterium]HNS48771.1 RNA 2',3'-cyclic phosphodiesterase [bacterium]